MAAKNELEGGYFVLSAWCTQAKRWIDLESRFPRRAMPSDPSRRGVSTALCSCAKGSEFPARRSRGLARAKIARQVGAKRWPPPCGSCRVGGRSAVRRMCARGFGSGGRPSVFKAGGSRRGWSKIGSFFGKYRSFWSRPTSSDKLVSGG